MTGALAVSTYGAGQLRRGNALGPLRRWLRRVLPAASARVQLPVEGLPAGIGEIPGGAVGFVLCAGAQSRERLLSSLPDMALPGRGVTWLSAGVPSPALLGAHGAAADARERLRVLAWSEDAASQVRQLGARHLLRELLTSGMGARDLLVVDAIEPWVADTPEGAPLEAGIAEALQCLLQWTQDHRGPILALAPTQRRGQSLLPLVAAARVPRLAILHTEGTQGRLDVLRWATPHRPGAPGLGARHELELSADGTWLCRSSSEFDLQALLAAPDARAVHAMRSTLHDAGELPDGWREYQSLEALTAAAGQAVAATLVLDHDHADCLPLLAGLIHRLRREHPQLLRIVVREIGASMRKNDELALRRLGADAILHRDYGFAQLEQLVEDVRSEPCAHKAVKDPTRLLQHLAPDPVRGWLPPLAFCAAVERMLERTADTPLEHSLVHLPLLPHLTPAEVLASGTPRRDGDLVSPDRHGLYVFLFACPADDAIAALDSFFALPCSEVARHVAIETDRHSQLLALSEFRRSLGKSNCSDPPWLAGAGGVRTGPVQAAVLPIRPDGSGRSVQAHVLPLRTAIA